MDAKITSMHNHQQVKRSHREELESTSHHTQLLVLRTETYRSQILVLNHLYTQTDKLLAYNRQGFHFF